MAGDFAEGYFHLRKFTFKKVSLPYILANLLRKIILGNYSSRKMFPKISNTSHQIDVV